MTATDCPTPSSAIPTRLQESFNSIASALSCDMKQLTSEPLHPDMLHIVTRRGFAGVLAHMKTEFPASWDAKNVVEKIVRHTFISDMTALLDVCLPGADLEAADLATVFFAYDGYSSNGGHCKHFLTALRKHTAITCRQILDVVLSLKPELMVCWGCSTVFMLRLLNVYQPQKQDVVHFLKSYSLTGLCAREVLQLFRERFFPDCDQQLLGDCEEPFFGTDLKVSLTCSKPDTVDWILCRSLPMRNTVLDSTSFQELCTLAPSLLQRVPFLHVLHQHGLLKPHFSSWHSPCLPLLIRHGSMDSIDWLIAKSVLDATVLRDHVLSTPASLSCCASSDTRLHLQHLVLPHFMVDFLDTTMPNWDLCESDSFSTALETAVVLENIPVLQWLLRDCPFYDSCAKVTLPLAQAFSCSEPLTVLTVLSLLHLERLHQLPMEQQRQLVLAPKVVQFVRSMETVEWLQSHYNLSADDFVGVSLKHHAPAFLIQLWESHLIDERSLSLELSMTVFERADLEQKRQHFQARMPFDVDTFFTYSNAIASDMVLKDKGQDGLKLLLDICQRCDTHPQTRKRSPFARQLFEAALLCEGRVDVMTALQQHFSLGPADMGGFHELGLISLASVNFLMQHCQYSQLVAHIAKWCPPELLSDYPWSAWDNQKGQRYLLHLASLPTDAFGVYTYDMEDYAVNWLDEVLLWWKYRFGSDKANLPAIMTAKHEAKDATVGAKLNAIFTMDTVTELKHCLSHKLHSLKKKTDACLHPTLDRLIEQVDSM